MWGLKKTRNVEADPQGEWGGGLWGGEGVLSVKATRKARGGDAGLRDLLRDDETTGRRDDETTRMAEND